MSSGGTPLEVGLLVASPPRLKVDRTAAGTSVGAVATEGRAVFDQLVTRHLGNLAVAPWIGLAVVAAYAATAVAIGTATFVVRDT